MNRGPPFAAYKQVVTKDPFLAHSKLGHNTAGRVVFGATLGVYPMQVQGLEREPYQPASDFRCKALSDTT